MAKRNKATTFPFKKEFIALEKKVSDLIQGIMESMDDQEFMTYLSTKSLSDITNIDSQTKDVDKRHNERLKKVNEQRRAAYMQSKLSK